MISYRIENIPISVLLRGIEEHHIFLQDRNINRGFIHWSDEKRGKYINSIFAGMPILPIIFDGTTRPWKVISGKEALTAILDFYNNKLKISRSKYIPLVSPFYYNNIPFFLKRKFVSTRIQCYVINPPTSVLDVKEIKDFFSSFYD